MSEEDILRSVNEIVAPYGLRAEIFGGIRRVCVRGDARAYLPVLNLIGPFPGYDVLAALSTKISNIFDIGGVTFQVAAAT
ncbi:MAG: hypothetical protein G01um101438_799 [Parcubacteria group bacterium Gr01-1014_38]|nr:MAG: hypothetical protein G01um101438_799 [Parcubacteria group bacterium Gr01-1014_38]